MAAHDIDGASTGDDHLVPWLVETEHRHAYPLMMLRLEVRRRSGAALTAVEESRLASWLDDLRQRNVVVLYDADTPDGFYEVPRKVGDGDLIRRPAGPTPRSARRQTG